MTPLAEKGATLADDIDDVATADVISVTVLNDEQVREVIAGERGWPARQAGHRDRDSLDDRRHHCRGTGPAARAGGHSYRRCSRQRRCGAATKGELAVMVGADDEAFERVKPVFEQWASLVVHAGEPGAGTRMKLARNMLTFTAFAAACEAQSLAEAAESTCRIWAGWCATATPERRPGRDHVPRRHETACAPTTSCTTCSPTPAGWPRRT